MPDKPKGMHSCTYEWLYAKAEEAEWQALAERLERWWRAGWLNLFRKIQGGDTRQLQG